MHSVPSNRLAALASIVPRLMAVTLALGCASGGPPPPNAETSGGAVVASDALVQNVLVRSCYGCHSSDGNLEWYAKLAPSAWFVGSAREKLDFSGWQGYDADRRKAELESIAKVVRSGDMPPWDFALFDSAAKLSPAEKESVTRWASEATTSAVR